MQNHLENESVRISLPSRSDFSYSSKTLSFSKILRHENMCSCMGKGQIPEAWRKAISILIYKKGETDDPGNFRPITLEPVLLKVFTSFLRNRMFEFMVKNNYAESCIQKGFIPGLSGTFEHIASMSHIINQAKLKQRSVTITLIDLRNAFGEWTII